jgi:bifunctional UDP-N-acetylglucosamine pyrophosphorylase/glucosamine-1-phosphate N-acetyltransferase
MKALFLCGGIGKRMSPFTEDKFLFKFLGETLLERQIERVIKAGTDKIIAVGNSSNITRIKELFGKFPHISFDTMVQEQPLGMANAVECAEEFLSDEPVLVLNPNDVFDTWAYQAILERHHNGSAVAYLMATEVSDYFPGGYLVANEKGELEQIVEKPEPGKEPSHLVNLVVHLHNQPRQFLRYIREKADRQRDDVYEQALEEMVRDGNKIEVVNYRGAWCPIKYPWHLLTAAAYFLAESEGAISKSAQISERAVLEGKVILADGVKILENAVIRGPAYIGEETIIGNNVLIRDHCHIGAHCVIGYGTEIKHSYIGDNCWFHKNFIGDSVIGNNCLLGAGTILANFRFDEAEVQVGEEKVGTGSNKFGAIIGDNCKIGINASILPGVKIGPNSIVGPNVCLTQNLAANKMLFAKAPEFERRQK